MGRQINFHIGPNDLDVIGEILQESGPHLIYSWNEERKQVPQSSLKEVSQEWFGMQHHIFLDEGQTPMPDKVTDRGDEYFDVYRKPILEFNGKTIPRFDRPIGMSRFFYEYKFWDGDVLSEKSPQFVGFCNRVFSRVRRRFKKSNGFWYIGPHAEELMASGVEFGQFP